MALPGHNEADTRAKLIDPALHARQWIELVTDEQRASHGEIHREQSAIRIDILDGKPLKRGRGRVDYLLRAYIEEHEQPLTLAFIEAKKEKLPPTQGLEQVKEYARRHAVKFVYSTNGHQFVEYDTTTGKTTDSFVYIDVSSIDTSTKSITNPKRISIADAPSRAQTIVSVGDILVSNVRPNLNTVAKVTPDLDGAICSSAFTVLRCGADLIPDYLFCFVQSPGFIDGLSSLAQGAHYPTFLHARFMR